MSAVVPVGDLPDMPFLRKQVAPDHLTQVIAEVLAGNSHDAAMGSTQSYGRLEKLAAATSAGRIGNVSCIVGARSGMSEAWSSRLSWRSIGCNRSPRHTRI